MQPFKTQGTRLCAGVALRLLNLSRRYPHDVDGVADDIGGALLALWSLEHSQSMPRGAKGREMESDEEKAIRYRSRAEEVRTLAALAGNQKTHAALLTVAEHYESMALALEELTKNKRFLGH